jgi:hypothetical protein
VYLLGARYYDPQVGVFLTRDTELDQHPYLYCNHDPINHLDPSGHKAITDWINDILNFNTPGNPPSFIWAGGASLIGVGSSVDYMTNPPKSGDIFHNGLGIGG